MGKNIKEKVSKSLNKCRIGSKERIQTWNFFLIAKPFSSDSVWCIGKLYDFPKLQFFQILEHDMVDFFRVLLLLFSSDKYLHSHFEDPE